jgi:hypothetical protein
VRTQAFRKEGIGIPVGKLHLDTKTPFLIRAYDINNI